jgi:DNA (cytosine-5)-methyltransferase 1
MSAPLAYYNEIDPFAAAWLRALIAAGHIANGEVDERSIVDVTAGDLAGFTQCHFFAGIGVWSYALRRARWADGTRVWTGSCPCQPFSEAGKGEGADDSRHLWPTWFRLISECRPDVVFGEQVAASAGLAWFDVVSTDLEGAGYAVGAADLGAASVGAPHIRQRLYFVADASNARRDCAREHERGPSPLSARSEQRGTPRTVADTKHAERRAIDVDGQDGRDRQDDRREEAYGEPRARGEVRGVAEPDETRRCEQWSARLPADADAPRRHDAERRCESRELGNAGNAGLQIGASDRRVSRSASGLVERESVDDSGVVRGFWRDAEWIACTDGKARPVEPGSFPLAHGAPARVGRLRGYGNGLCAPTAIAFIEAYLDVAGEQGSGGVS